MTALRVTFFFALCLLVTACGPNIPDPNRNGNGNGNGEEIEPVWPEVLDIFAASCAQSGCHGTGSTILELIGEEAYDTLVNTSSEQVPALARVEPGDPDYSYLYLKVIGLHADACNDAGIPVSQCGTQMPPPPNPQLPQAQIDAIRGWISGGALLTE